MCYDIFKFIRTLSVRLGVISLCTHPVTLSPLPSHRDPCTLPSAFCPRSIYDVTKIYKHPQYGFSTSCTEPVSNPKKAGAVCPIGISISHSAARAWVLPYAAAMAKPGKT